jgi:hypothetical protein
MACCAFAAFLFGQMLLVWGTLKRVIRRQSPPTPADLPNNPAVAWRLVSRVAEDAARADTIRSITLNVKSHGRRISFRVLAVVAALEVVLVVAAGYGIGWHYVHHQSVSAAHHP